MANEGEGSHASESCSPGNAVRAARILDGFAERTAIRSPATGATRRYLWTDAYAVCTFVGLHRTTGEPRHLATAKALVDVVHEGLGRHRADDVRTGWLSGLPDDEARRHPTRAGLRIGKPRPERAAGEPFDEHAEWERDGQYFHYLTRWMHALLGIARATGDGRYVEFAVELALAAHGAFAYTRAGGGRAMHWKMSIDLTRPLVPSMGQHDPLDGWLVLLEVRAARHGPQSVTLDAAIADLRAMAQPIDWGSTDGLGIGGLLAGACALARLHARGAGTLPDAERADAPQMLARLLAAAAAGLRAWQRRSPLLLPAAHRLAFRELGLAIGLHAVPRIAVLPAARDDHVRGPLSELQHALPLADTIVATWLDPANHGRTWREHRDIDEVMLAAALAPGGYLGD